jgi:hypothetical protein
MVYPLFILEYPRCFRYALEVKKIHVLDCWFYYEYISDAWSIQIECRIGFEVAML